MPERPPAPAWKPPHGGIRHGPALRSSLGLLTAAFSWVLVSGCASSGGAFPQDASPGGDAESETDAAPGTDAGPNTDAQAHCGDGHLDPGETCDDGNTVSGDGCSASCQAEACTPTSCPGGCCDLAGVCQPGVQDSACGASGSPCQVCQTPNQICRDQACQAPPPCTSGTTEGCGLCGLRTCQGDDTWGACQGEGTCSPSQVDQGAACPCGVLERSCLNDCTWGPWTCQGACPTLEMAYNGQAHFELDTQGIGANIHMHFLSVLKEAGTLRAYHIRGYALGGISRFATGLALSTDGLTFQDQGIVLDIGGTPEQTFNAVTDLSHQIGRVDSGGWSANTADDTPAFLIFGPYQAGWSGPNVASFQLLVDANFDHTHVVNLEVYDASGGSVLATRTLYRDDFAATFTDQVFPLNFTATPSQSLEFRVYWHGTTYTRVEAIGVAQGQAPFFDDRLASFPGIWESGGVYSLVYEGAGTDSAFPGDIGLATSTDGVSFSRSPDNPFLVHSPTGWESTNIGTPSLYEHGGTFFLFYHGFNGLDVQIGLATFAPGNPPQKYAGNPVIPTSASDWDSGTVGKRSRIYEESGYYYLAYEGSTDPPYNTADWSTGLARSSDLYTWTKSAMNPVLPVVTGSYGNDGPELVQIDGQYYLYVRSAGNTTDRYALWAN